mmetsp:Transcript_16846/g.36578  ORF Transcript_16846/g.36578 Transcript_16846/m.36578 type:complete len:204 (-) Transcript_16846:992-1603(-)
MYRRTIKVPPKYHGKVVGRGGVTLAEITTQTGVKLIVPSRGSGNHEVVVLADHEPQIEHAERRIQDLCDLDLGIPKTEGEMLRERANVAGARRAELYRKRREACRVDGKLAKELPEKAKMEAQIMEKFNANPADAIFDEKNCGRGMVFRRQLLRKNNANGLLEIITGQGRHGDNGTRKIPTALQETYPGDIVHHDEGQCWMQI